MTVMRLLASSFALASGAFFAPAHAADAATDVEISRITLKLPTPAHPHKAELESKGITEQQLNQEGLKISTTIDPTLQKLANDTANRSRPHTGPDESSAERARAARRNPRRRQNRRPD